MAFSHFPSTTLPQLCIVLVGLLSGNVYAQSTLPIADAHIHYSHDSVEFTPAERVIELMRGANLKFALVSSSDDNGTQLLSELAPDLIVPGLRPYRRRGETSTWFTDDGALAYVEQLLENNHYATIGEFHLYGESADLPIPRRIVELADEYNLILHAHSDADAVERLLAQSPDVKVLWAHSGFESPEDIANMLAKHDRLWADLAFRSEVGSGGQLSSDWIELFTQFPDRMMLGTDTYTPERMYFLPEHAAGARVWLESLPLELAENVAWKNAFNLIMPHWDANKPQAQSVAVSASEDDEPSNTTCGINAEDTTHIVGDAPTIVVQALQTIQVSEPFSVLISVCDTDVSDMSLELNATMPAHGHGMNYEP
ncbi:MAG: amidohydrolase, partial [Gammaproteobacteria bacterium]|nr:amidohydrolase [Gammaproteobacteria bacterium]